MEKSLSELLLPDWIRGCALCRNGFIGSLPTIRNDHQTTADVMLSAFVADKITFCDCEAGQKARAGLMKRASAPSDAVLAQQAKAVAVKKRKDRLFAEANVPPRFCSFTFKGYTEATRGDTGKRAAKDAILNHFKGSNAKRGIMLCGPTGTGKTGALSPLFLHYMDKNYSGLWLPYFEMMASFRDFESGQVTERMEVAQVVDYLFIDDMGDPKRKEATDYERETVFRLIDHRNNWGMPMFITSNLSANRLADYYRIEIVKRLEESCEIVEVTGKRLGVAS